MEALATVEELATRLPFVMDDDELREAGGALEDLSDDARHYGSTKWENKTKSPRQVVNLVLKAAVRHMKNPDGYTVSRAGDESVSWSDKGPGSGTAHFIEAEIKRLHELGGYRGSGFFTVNTFAYQSHDAPENGLVPVQGSNEKFPMYSGTEPW